ncbi:hypothetical protein ACJMK2_022876, partial [Sinanodonta woodiana]
KRRDLPGYQDAHHQMAQAPNKDASRTNTHYSQPSDDHQLVSVEGQRRMRVMIGLEEIVPCWESTRQCSRPT